MAHKSALTQNEWVVRWRVNNCTPRGVAPGYINLAPLGLFGSYLSYFGFSKSLIFSLLEYKYCTHVIRWPTNRLSQTID
jgi:hypothetical protein